MTEIGHRALLRFGLRVRALVERGGFEPELWESGSGAVRRSIVPRMGLNGSSTPGVDICGRRVRIPTAGCAEFVPVLARRCVCGCRSWMSGFFRSM